jgi:hypothetical protein
MSLILNEPMLTRGPFLRHETQESFIYRTSKTAFLINQLDHLTDDNDNNDNVNDNKDYAFQIDDGK